MLSVKSGLIQVNSGGGGVGQVGLQVELCSARSRFHILMCLAVEADGNTRSTQWNYLFQLKCHKKKKKTCFI